MMNKSFYPKKVWLNGRLVDPRAPRLSVFDRGFLYGDGVYETLRVYRGRPFRLEGHYRRLVRSARGVGIPLTMSLPELHRAILSLIRVNGLEDSSVRVTLSRGPGPLGFDPRPCRTPTLLITPGPNPRHDPRHYARGVKVVLARTRRNPPVSLDPALKTTNNLNNILAKREAIAAGAYEAVMLNIDGYLAEGTISNLFFLKGRRLFTPSLNCGILEGVTRMEIARLARKRGLAVTEGRFRPDRFFSSDEAFLTSTTFEVMPVTRAVDDRGRVRRIADGRVGRWAPILRSDYLELVEREVLS